MRYGIKFADGRVMWFLDAKMRDTYYSNYTGGVNSGVGKVDAR